jgi:hypothetical protein
MNEQDKAKEYYAQRDAERQEVLDFIGSSKNIATMLSQEETDQLYREVENGALEVQINAVMKAEQEKNEIAIGEAIFRLKKDLETIIIGELSKKHQK